MKSPTRRGVDRVARLEVHEGTGRRFKASGWRGSEWMDGWMDEGGLVGTDTHTTFLSLLNVCHSPSSLPEYAAHTIVSRVDTMYVRGLTLPCHTNTDDLSQTLSHRRLVGCQRGEHLSQRINAAPCTMIGTRQAQGGIFFSAGQSKPLDGPKKKKWSAISTTAAGRRRRVKTGPRLLDQQAVMV